MGRYMVYARDSQGRGWEKWEVGGGLYITPLMTSPLVLGHKYPKMGEDILYWRSDTHRAFTIYFFNPCFRILVAWDK